MAGDVDTFSVNDNDDDDDAAEPEMAEGAGGAGISFVPSLVRLTSFDGVLFKPNKAV